MGLLTLSLRFAARSPKTHFFVMLIRQYAKLSMAGQSELQGIDMNVELSVFCREGELKEALTLLQFMGKNRIPIKSYAYECLLQTCARAKALPQGREIYSYMKTSGLDQNVVLANKLVSMFIACRSSVDARSVFDKVENRDIILWNAMISGYVSCGLSEKALALYDQMQNEGLKPDHFTFPCVLKACGVLLALERGKEIHDFVVSIGLESDIFVSNALVDMYAKCRVLEFARQVFDKMPERSVVTWNTMVAGYVQNGQVKEAFKLFYQMQVEGVFPNPTTVVNVLPACANARALRQGKEIHCFVRKRGIDSDGFVGNALIDMYAKCRRITDAIKVFDKMCLVDVVSWNAMVAGFMQNGFYDDALKLFGKMQTTGVKPNSFTFVSVLPACGRLKALQEGMEIHACVIKTVLESHVFVGGALVDMYSKCENIKDAEQIFYRISHRDVVSWNAMIVGYVQNGQCEEAFKLFHQMHQLGPKPNSVTIASLLPACSRLVALHQGKELHDYIVRRGFDAYIVVGNALVDMYAKCGSMVAACKVFENMKDRTEVSWNAIISAFGMHGHIDKALTLFAQMQESGPKPDHITFVAVLSACSHSGLVDEGWNYFDRMSQEFGIMPRMEHYACMVDLLGRAGRLDEAYDLITSMPFEPDSDIWGTLLAACKIHCNIELAEQAAEHLFLLEPENTGFYVLLSNIYASTGRWNDVAKVRKIMRDRGMRKKPGCSWIEVDRNAQAL